MRGSEQCGADIPVCRWGGVLDWARGQYIAAGCLLRNADGIGREDWGKGPVTKCCLTPFLTPFLKKCCLTPFLTPFSQRLLLRRVCALEIPKLNAYRLELETRLFGIFDRI